MKIMLTLITVKDPEYRSIAYLAPLLLGIFMRDAETVAWIRPFNSLELNRLTRLEFAV